MHAKSSLDLLYWVNIVVEISVCIFYDVLYKNISLHLILLVILVPVLIEQICALTHAEHKWA